MAGKHVLAETKVPSKATTDPLHSIPSAAQFVGGISEWTIRAWLRDGKLRRTKVGARTMIRESELQKVIEDQ